MVSYGALGEGVVGGDASLVEAEVSRALDEGAEPRDILINGLIGGMSVVGKHFRAGEMFLPEVLMSAQAMHQGLNMVKPLLGKSGQKAMGRIVIGAVEGDIHDIGKKIVSFMLEGNGCEVTDLGVDVKPETFVQALEEHKPDVLGMSALLTTTMPNMAKTIDLVKKRGLRDKVKIIVGGAPINEQFAQSIGADGHAPEASSAVELVKRLLGS